MQGWRWKQSKQREEYGRQMTMQSKLVCLPRAVALVLRVCECLASRRGYKLSW